MQRICGVVMLAAMLMGGTVLLERTLRVAAEAPAGIKNVVLVLGAFADGSGWEAVAKILGKDGYTATVAQPPEVNASHVAYMSHPKETAKLIEEAATYAISSR